MKMDVRTVKDVRIVDWSGKITLGEETMAFRQTVRDLVKHGAKKIVINLGDVVYIDSSGVGELVSTYATVNNNGGQLKLLKLSNKIHELLTLTKLLTVFEVFDNEQDALASFE